MNRRALAAMILGAALAVWGSRDAWSTLGSGFYAPDPVLMWVYDLTALGVAAFAAAALGRRSAALAHLAALIGLLLSGGLLAVLVAFGSGADELDRGGHAAAGLGNPEIEVIR